jgi:hypothetical protein
MPEEQKENSAVTYTDPEVSRIMYTLQTIYALDDAIASQVQLRRPDGFIRPLSELREIYASDLKNITSKSEPEAKPDKT